MGPSYTLGLLITLSFFACCVATEVQELDVTPNTLESFLRHNPPDLEDGDSVQDYGDGFHIRESHVEHLAHHIGHHLKWTANHLKSMVKHVEKEKTFSPEWLQKEITRYHAEEGHPATMKRRARAFIETRAHNRESADYMWKKANADEFYDKLGTHDQEYIDKHVKYDAEKDPEYHEQLKIFDDWMANNRHKLEPDAPSDDESEPDELGEGMEVDTSREWKLPEHHKAKSTMIASVVEPPAPKQAANIGRSKVVQSLQRAGYTETDLERILDIVKDSDRRNSHALALGESAGNTCTPGQCADVLRSHISDTTAEIQKLTGKAVPPMEGGKGGAAGGGAVKSKPANVVNQRTGKTEPLVTIGSGPEDKMGVRKEGKQWSKNDIRGEMENGGGADGEPLAIREPGATQKDPPAPPHTPPPAPDEIPPGCPATADRFACKSEEDKSPACKCKRFPFMGPFACWKMGMGQHSMAGEKAGADFRTIMRDSDFYPASQKRKIVDLADFRWRYTAGKCMWWNQMYRSMNEPLWIPDTNLPEGAYKVTRICLIYSLMMSRHWSAQDEGTRYEIALLRGLMTEFGSNKKDPMLPESAALVKAMQTLNNDHIGSVWTILYELGMTPCGNYVIMFAMIVEALLGPPMPLPFTIKKPACLDKLTNTPNVACQMHGEFISLTQKMGPLGQKVRALGLKMISLIPPLAFTKPAVNAFSMILEKLDKAVLVFRGAFDAFYDIKAQLSDPLDILWILLGDLIGIMDILFRIPIVPIQKIFEGLIKMLKLNSVMGIINKFIGMVIKIVFHNPIVSTILKGPLKICSLILKAFTQNPVAKGLIKLMKGLLGLLDKPIKFSIFTKRYCFTILGILKKVGRLFQKILDKVMGMIKAVLKPIFDLIDKAFKKIASLVKLPDFGIMKGILGKSGGLMATLKSIGALDNPLTQHLTCSFNLPWVQYTGQNLCNCCFLGFMASSKVNVGWSYNYLQAYVKEGQKKKLCSKWVEKDPTCPILKPVDYKAGMLQTLFSGTCAYSKVTGALTSTGKAMFGAHRCIPKKVKVATALTGILFYVMKGFMCRFQNIGLNPKVMMQLSPLPKIELFRRRRGGAKKTTPGEDKCFCYVARRRHKGAAKKKCAGK